MKLHEFVGSKIKEFRLSKGMNQEVLAELLDTTKQTISRYESGDRKANQDVLFHLSEVFNVSIDDFFPEREIEGNELERALKMTEGMDVKDIEFLNQLIEKTLSLEGADRTKFLESIKFTVDYYKNMNE